jgi:hypothetical protein
VSGAGDDHANNLTQKARIQSGDIGVVLALLIYLIDAIPIFEPYRQVARTVPR